MVIMAMNSNDRPTLAYCKNGIKLHSNVPWSNIRTPKNLIALNGSTTAQNMPSAIHKLKEIGIAFSICRKTAKGVKTISLNHKYS